MIGISEARRSRENDELGSWVGIICDKQGRMQLRGVCFFSISFFGDCITAVPPVFFSCLSDVSESGWGGGGCLVLSCLGFCWMMGAWWTGVDGKMGGE